MTHSPPAGEGRTLPPLPAEDHVCQECDISYSTVTVEDARRRVLEAPEHVRVAAVAVPADRRRQRPRPATWSIVEYVCHVRDVYASYTIRLHRTRTEERPALEPMFNDLRARRFHHNERNLACVLDELAANAAGFSEEIDKVSTSDWDRVVTRLPGEDRTARWLLRQVMHEGIHHLRDITTVGRAVVRDD